MNLEGEFIEWLKLDQDLSETSANKYVGAVRTISRFLSEELDQEINIFEISNKAGFEQIMKLIENNKKTFNRYNTENRMYSNGVKRYEEFIQLRTTRNQDVYYEDELLAEEFIEKEVLDKKIMISKFTKDLLREKGFILDDSDNTRIRFSTERLDSIVGFLGEGWSKQIKRLLLFEIENKYEYTLKLIIGPGNQDVRKTLHTIAKGNIELYNSSNGKLFPMFKTIYSKKILDKEQLTTFSIEQIKKYIEDDLEEFIKYDLIPLCEGLKSQQQIDLETELLEIKNDDRFNDLEDKYKESVIKSRIGQGKYRDGLIEKHGCKCMICNIKLKELLIASHIKEFSISTKNESIDLNNGLLLCANHDKLFDRHLISFDNKGKLIISDEIKLSDYEELKISEDIFINMNEEINKYMEYHRNMMEQKST